MLLPVSAHGQSDSVMCFRFKRSQNMFWADYKENRLELERLFACVEKYKVSILTGEMPLYVEGHCHSASTESRCLLIAKIRSNRVKSELITRKGLKEECFITRNHADGGDLVTVRITVPVSYGGEAEGESAAGIQVADTLSSRPVTNGRGEGEKSLPVVDDQKAAPVGRKKGGVPLCLRTNLLRWGSLTPDLGIEWRLSRSWSLSANASWTSWGWNGKDRRYALWEVAPEVRHYIGCGKRGYLGAVYKVGQFNYKFSATGRQGDIMGGGLTGGYQFDLNRSLSLDFGAGVGYLRVDYDKYAVIDGVRVKRGEESKNWWGPISVGVSLVWNLFEK